ncbi:MAG: hypothetical protein LVQ95_02765 [Candidatus Micrarchaeales archaeon]|nr:hypothetical protein [Candidatus Micrarchaeales archaeon]
MGSEAKSLILPIDGQFGAGYRLLFLHTEQGPGPVITNLDKYIRLPKLENPKKIRMDFNSLHMKLYIQIEGQTIIVHSTYHRGLVDMKPTYNGG